MIKSIRCSGYRCYAKRVDIDLTPLTVIFGKNNSGKSTLARLPIFIEASLGSPDLFALELKNARFGTSFNETANNASGHPSLHFGVTLHNGESIDVTLQEVRNLLDTFVSVTRFETNRYQEGMSLADLGTQDATTESPRERDIQRIKFAQSLGSSLIIPSDGRLVAGSYETRDADWGLWSDAPHMLNQSRDVLTSTSEWFSNNFGITVSCDRSAFSFSLTSSDGRNTVNLGSTGKGTQALLFVVACIMAIRLNLASPSLLVIEEPEAHLHPAAHGAVAELLTTLPADCQVIVESHSDNLILRLRRLVAEGRVSASSLSLAYVDQDNAVRPIKVRDDGTVDYWPAGVFEEDVEEARLLLMARLGRQGLEE